MALELWQRDATTLSAMLAAGTVTPDDLVETALARCEALQPALNAFVLIDTAGARDAAAQATERQRRGERRGALDGIPVSIKDNLFVAGLPAAWGSLLFAAHRPERDDICVERLRAAGAVIVGKTTTPEFALLGRTDSKLTGITRNPWNPGLTPGGSSGGAAASVAAGMVPLAIGTDAGGSIRTPASFTGLVGMRPSNGRVPRRYGFPPMALDFQAIGLLARTMADLDLLLGVVGGADRRDPTSTHLPPLDAPAGPLRVGWFTSVEGEGCDAAVDASHAAAREALARLGHEIVQVPAPFDLRELRALWGVLTAAGAARVAMRFPDWRQKVTDVIGAQVEAGLKLSATAYVDVLDRLQVLRSETSRRWGDLDALLLPTAPAPAWPADRPHPDEIGGRPGSESHLGIFCGWVNALGSCGLSIPGLPHPDGRPIGLQLVAPPGRDGVALHLARQLERSSPWAERWPALASSAAV